MHDKFIVKVQTSLFSSDGVKTAMVYNEDRSVMHEETLTWEMAQELGDEPKCFWWAERKWDEKNKGYWINMIKPAPWQDW